MTFTITTPPDDPQNASIKNDGFFPDIDPGKVRESQRIDGTIVEKRLNDAIVEAVSSVNSELGAWKAQQVTAGAENLADVPASKVADVSILVHRYHRAVGCLAKAAVLERYRDYDSTAKGDRKAEALADPIDDLRRDARWAISDILGLPRTTVELI